MFYFDTIIYSLSSCFKPELVSFFVWTEVILKNVVTNSFWSTATFKVNVDHAATITHILQNIFFCVQHKKEINAGLGQHVSE